MSTTVGLGTDGILGVPEGTEFASFAELNASGVHRPSQGGIGGTARAGADSVVVSGGYADDLDMGNVIVYTGQGGRDASGRHVKDQELVRGNQALVTSQIRGLPVRVIRGAHPGNPYAPKSGYRYDGFFRVESHWREKGASGFEVWRYRLEKIGGGADQGQGNGQAQYDGNSNPQRVAITVQRIVRDTKQARALKVRYQHSCQVCGISLVTAGGVYAEAAHIRPLGAPHYGPDTLDNIICLCPNHHVLFDLGAFSIADDMSLIGIAGTLVLRDDHKISGEHLAYHRTHYLNAQKK